jgi:hypothetical protein
MDAYTAGFRSAKYHSPLERLRLDWQFQPPHGKSRIDDTYFRKGVLDGRRAVGRPTPGQEYLLEQSRRIPMDNALQAAVEEGILRTPDKQAHERARSLQNAFSSIQVKLARIREIQRGERIKKSLAGIPEFDPSWDYQ